MSLKMKDQTQSSGVLYVVATPIGNLQDISLRALETLKKVDLILCEDKRVTSKLLNKYEIKTKIKSYHKYNEHDSVSEVISLLQSGSDIALVSDAGTPLVSDPGKILISAVTEQKIRLIPVPGASSLLAALSVCPFECNEFLFIGFLPENKTKRKELIHSLKNRSKTIVVFIAPHDMKKYLTEISSIYPLANILLAREISKIYEEFWSGEINNLLDLVNAKNFKGEIVVILHLDKYEEKTDLNKDDILLLMKESVAEGYSLKETSKTFAKQYDLSAKELYDLYVKRFLR